MRMVPALNGTKSLRDTHLFTLAPNSTETFTSIQLELESEELCEGKKYSLDISYSLELNTDLIGSTDHLEAMISKLKDVEMELEAVLAEYHLDRISVSDEINQLENKLELIEIVIFS